MWVKWGAGGVYQLEGQDFTEGEGEMSDTVAPLEVVVGGIAEGVG